MNKIKNIIKYLIGLLEIDIVRIVFFSIITIILLMAFVHRIVL